MFSIDRWMEDYRKAAEKCFGDRELEELSALLLDWASGWIRRSSENSDIVYGSYER